MNEQEWEDALDASRDKMLELALEVGEGPEVLALAYSALIFGAGALIANGNYQHFVSALSGGLNMGFNAQNELGGRK